MIDFNYIQLGNNNPEAGQRLLHDIANRLNHSRTKHPKSEWDNKTIHDAYNALHDEVHEVKEAIWYEPSDRIKDELLDVIAVAVRMLNKEYK